ncbi:MAG: hypothetical protein HY738_17000 [Bacteroidia bacterium]|nr:hypothetical protein [Bacteroidia bacterium]
MKKIKFTFLGLCLTILTFGQTTNNEKLIELAKTYKDFLFRNEPTNEILKDIKADIPENLKATTEFIVQTITTRNDLLSQQFLGIPDDITIKQIYIVDAIFENLRDEHQIDNNKLIDSLTKKEIQRYELIDNYYGMLFTAVGNKNQPFNLSKFDIKIKDCNLRDDTEKGILFLRCMSFCGSEIWGYMNIPKPANTKEAYKNIKKFPKFNGLPYYEFSDFYFPDFEMIIIKDKGVQSYKSYYLDKYFEILLYHLICINKENGSEKEKNDLLLGSILKETNLYKYTKYKETLEGIFKEVKKE